MVARPLGEGAAIKPAPFDYVCVDTIKDAVAHLDRAPGETRILAGGQSLIAMLNMRLATPRLLVDVSRIASAARIETTTTHIGICCAVRQAELERWPGLPCELPLIAKALPWIGHVQTRSKGTVCGSIAHADPSSELPLCLAVLDGEVLLQARNGSRTVRGRDFFVGLLDTSRRANEVISEVRFPRAVRGEGAAFNEMAVRHGDFAILAVAAIARADGLVLGIGGAIDRPVVVEWPATEGAALAEALEAVAWSLDCRGDLHASAAYRRHLIRRLGAKTIVEAMACRT